MAAKQKLTLVIVGDGGVGKSSITLSFVRKEFNEEYDPTIEDSYTAEVNVDGIEYAVEVCDTAGQEEYRGLWEEQTAASGDAFILTYSVDSRASFLALPDLLHTIRRVKHEDEDPPETLSPVNTPFPFVVVGNKCDLADRRQVSAAEGLAFAKAGGGLFVECSAKNGVNVQSVFDSLIRSTARVRAAEKEHNKRSRVPFNRNIGLMDYRDEAKANGIAFDEKSPPPRTSDNKDLIMDKRRSQSLGGLGRDQRKSEAEDEGGCCCVIS